MKKSKKPPVCAITATLDVLGGKWKIFILNQLVAGTRRFGELKRAIPGVTQKMLTQQLRELEEVGLLTRRVYPEMPPRVEYTLSAHGLTLSPVLRALNEWGHHHRQYLGVEGPGSCDLAAANDQFAGAPASEVKSLVPELTMRLAPSPYLNYSHEALTEAVRAAAMG